MSCHDYEGVMLVWRCHVSLMHTPSSKVLTILKLRYGSVYVMVYGTNVMMPLNSLKFQSVCLHHSFCPVYVVKAFC